MNPTHGLHPSVHEPGFWLLYRIGKVNARLQARFMASDANTAQLKAVELLDEKRLPHGDRWITHLNRILLVESGTE